ncbi:MAG: ABC transporter ATP-binding protein [Trueperaceae bacterium]
MIRVSGLVKRYGPVHAVDGVDLHVAAGEVVALLGPNGAGKSTTIKAITGMLRPTRGVVEILGHDLAKRPIDAKRAFGYVPDRPYLYPKLTGRELLRFLVRLRRVEDGEAHGEALLASFGLADAADALIETYSHGMRQRLTFVSALLHRPPALVIDEPMVGLDPRGARDVRALMRSHADDGGAVLLTTHSMEVAQAVADRVLVMAKGRIAAHGTMAELRARVGRDDADLEAIFLQITDEDLDARHDVVAGANDALPGGPAPDPPHA